MTPATFRRAPLEPEHPGNAGEGREYPADPAVLAKCVAFMNAHDATPGLAWQRHHLIVRMDDGSSVRIKPKPPSPHPARAVA